ncbi:MAG: hypothetical protein V4501_02690 [Pseudomonadota bacterium]
MKKFAIALLATAVISAPCYAKGNVEDLLMVCGYTDIFHLGNDSVKNVTISSIAGDEKVVVGQAVLAGQTAKDPTSFFIKDAPGCLRNGGYAHVRYQTDKNNYCDLAVHDAENFFHPEITARCEGSLKFAGWTYDGVNTHSYSLNFAS